MLQDFEVTFFPRSVRVETLDAGSDHPAAPPIDDLNGQQQRWALCSPISQPACTFQKQVVLRLYVCDASTSTRCEKSAGSSEHQIEKLT